MQFLKAENPDFHGNSWIEKRCTNGCNFLQKGAPKRALYKYDKIILENKFWEKILS